MTRDDGIAWLRAAGRNAQARDWSKGQTIVVTFGAPSTGDVPVYPGAIYLYPTDDGRWHLWDLALADPTERYDDIAAAVRGADAYVARKDRELAGDRG